MLSRKLLIWVGRTFLALSAAFVAFLVIFPMVSVAKEGGKPSPEKAARSEALFQRKHREVVIPIRNAIRAGDEQAVRSMWLAYQSREGEFGGWWEDPRLRLRIAKFWVKRGKWHEARMQLDKILHPGAGFTSTLQTSGEVQSLWTTVNERLGLGPGAEQMSPQERAELARAEWRAGQTLTTLSQYPEALAHYERSVQLDPNDPELWLSLQSCRLVVKDRAGAKQAGLRAVQVSPPGRRGEIRVKARLSEAEVGH